MAGRWLGWAEVLGLVEAGTTPTASLGRVERVQRIWGAVLLLVLPFATVALFVHGGVWRVVRDVWLAVVLVNVGVVGWYLRERRRQRESRT